MPQPCNLYRHLNFVKSGVYFLSILCATKSMCEVSIDIVGQLTTRAKRYSKFPANNRTDCNCGCATTRPHVCQISTNRPVWPSIVYKFNNSAFYALGDNSTHNSHNKSIIA